MLLAQRVKRRILADREAQMELDAALDEPVDAAHHDLLLQLEAGDAIGEEPARAVVAVIDMHLMPLRAQIFGRGQARRTRADHTDRLAGRRADVQRDRKSTRLNSSHYCATRMPSSAWKTKQACISAARSHT